MGQAYSTYTQIFPPAATWGVDDIPDLSGRIAVVTGGYAGIGTETVKALLTHNCKVYISGRDQSKAGKTITALKSETGKDAHFIKMDLGNLQSIKAAAEELASKEQAVHILFNNAGVMLPPIEMTTSDGYDLQWGTNTLGHWYFSKLLLPLLKAGAASSPDGKARVLHTSSMASERAHIDFATFRDGPKRLKAGAYPLYPQSKLGNILVSNAMARKYGSDNIISVAINPGTLKTELTRHTNGMVAIIILATRRLWVR